MKNLIFLLLSIITYAQQSVLDSLVQNLNPTGFTGVSIYNPKTQEYTYQYNAHKNFIPASNLKVFTFYNYYNANRDSIPSLMYVERTDTIYASALGDPTFLDDRFSSKNIDEFFKNTNKTIALDITFHETKYAKGWTWDDYQYSYMPERNKFPIAGNIVSKNDSLSKYFTYVTDVYFDQRRKFNKNIFSYANHKKTPFITSDSLILTILKDRYNKNIILRNNKSLFLQKNTIKRVYSNPTSVVLKEMMLESDNFIAEQLAWQDSKLLRIKKNNSIGGIPIERNNLYDGSGLSRYNLTSPNNIVLILEKIQQEIPNYLAYFPENGISGTLKNSYLTESSYIFAKTGSMSGVYNLSGYIKTNSGKTLIFSLLNNNHTVKNSSLKPTMEEILLYIKRNY